MQCQLLKTNHRLQPRSLSIIAGLVLALGLFSPPVLAQDASTLRRALPPLDAQIAAQFPAIGRLGSDRFQVRQGCTATLIAPTLILTAGHCASKSGHSGREYFAGWYDGNFVAARHTALEIRHPAYSLDGVHRPNNDIALIVLDGPIEGVTPIPLGNVAHDALEGTDVALLGYHRRNPDRISGSFSCPVSFFGEGLYKVGCPVANGNSGAPILSQTEDGDWMVVGVVSSTLPGAAVVVEVSDWLRREVAAAQGEAQ